MNATFRHYSATPGFSVDYNLVRDFLVRIYANLSTAHDFPWGRWEWAFSFPHHDDHISKIGIWEANGTIVGLATYEDVLGSAYFSVDAAYGVLKQEMLRYCANELSVDGRFRALIPDTDGEFQLIASRNGFRPTESQEHRSVFDIDFGSLRYALPDGFRVQNLSTGYDIRKYGRVLWRGFNHQGEMPESELDVEDRMKSLVGCPHANLQLKVAAISPQDEYVSFCGMWYEAGTENALVEPVATDPAFRRKGLGKAVVLEGIRQCGILGAKRAFVDSCQQFYYSIGFRPLPSSTWWERRMTKDSHAQSS